MSTSYTSVTFLDANDAQVVARAAEAAAALETSSEVLPGETCAALNDVVYGYPDCHYARPCRSCLQKRGCAITRSGMCDLDPHTVGGDYFRNAIDQNLVVLSPNTTLLNATGLNWTYQGWVFPALDATYCDSIDSVCRECRENRFWTSNLNDNYYDSRFCIGANGCVCISNCVDAEYNSTPRAYVMCSSSYGSGQVTDPTTGFGMGLVVFAAFAAITGGLAIVRSIRKQKARNRFQADQRQQSREARELHRQQRLHQVSIRLGIGVLSLTTWKAYRDKLIRNEERHLAGLDDIGSPASPPETAYGASTGLHLELGQASTIEESTVTPRNGLR